MIIEQEGQFHTSLLSQKVLREKKQTPVHVFPLITFSFCGLRGTDIRHSNGNKLCPSPNRHIAV